MKNKPLFALFLGFTTLSCAKKEPEFNKPQEFNYEKSISDLGIEPKKIEKIDSVLKAFIDQKKYNCVTAFVAQGGNVLYKKSFGMKDIEEKIPASPDDYYIWFSQTKAITTVAFMTLVEQGKVKIDEPVSKYFPEIPNTVVTKVNPDGTYQTRPVSTSMTFVHLMSHTSGLNAGLVNDIRKNSGQKLEAPAGFGGPLPEKQFAGQRTWSTNFDSKYLADEMTDLAKYPLGFDPGSEWNYHPSTNMLAYLIERISGKSLRDYVKENVLLPLGMNNTDWYFAPDSYSKFVRAYDADNGKLTKGTDLYIKAALTKEQSFAEGGLGLNGPISDYARFCQMLLNKGNFNGKPFLKPETIDAMTKINRLPEKNSAAPGFEFGLGFELFNPNKKIVPAMSDSAYAWGGMFGTEYLIDPENDLIVLFYVNMFKREFLYPEFLKVVYEAIEKPKKH